jgi:hypothetical protein
VLAKQYKRKDRKIFSMHKLKGVLIMRRKGFLLIILSKPPAMPVRLEKAMPCPA